MTRAQADSIREALAALKLAHAIPEDATAGSLHRGSALRAACRREVIERFVGTYTTNTARVEAKKFATCPIGIDVIRIIMFAGAPS